MLMRLDLTTALALKIVTQKEEKVQVVLISRGHKTIQ